MTERIYYTDSACCEFDATVTTVESRHGRTLAVLDRTAFHPTGGGQPCDTGTIGEASVTDVIELASGDVGHLLDGGVTIGQRVHGRLDWSCRFDHMQQHTGQHLLSAVCDRLHGAETLSMHLGRTSCTIDLDADLSASAIAAAEREANRLVWDNRRVSVRFELASEALALHLRRKPARSGMVRLVEIGGIDLSACGGTHVSRTGAIGIIVVSSWEHVRRRLRLSFLCGARAMRAFDRQRDTLADVVRLLSVLPSELPDAIVRLQSERKMHLRSVESLQKRLSNCEASAVAAGATRSGRLSVVARVVAGADAAGLRRLAAAVTANSGYLVALVSDTGPVHIVIARSRDVAFDAREALRELTATYGGRGGGRPDFAQGGGLSGEPAALLAAVRHALRDAR